MLLYNSYCGLEGQCASMWEGSQQKLHFLRLHSFEVCDPEVLQNKQDLLLLLTLFCWLFMFCKPGLPLLAGFDVPCPCAPLYQPPL